MVETLCRRLDARRRRGATAWARRAVTASLLASVVASLAGCQSASSNGDRHLALTLSRTTADSRHTLIELKPDGRLFFAGGQDAIAGELHPAGTLTAEQRRAVWAVIEKHNLTEASGSLFPKGDAVYRLKLNTGGLGSHNIHSADDDVPGLAELHDLLFKMQADVRYRIPGIE